MRNTRAALYFIVEILQKEQIPFEVDGGFAAYLYGAGRPLADIDINVPKEHFHKIIPHIHQYLTFGPARYEDKQWRLTLMSFKYAGQIIDISALGEIEYFDSISKTWKEFPSDMSGQRIIRYEDLDLPVINEVKLVIYKEQLHRGVDLKDIAGMVRSLFSSKKPQVSQKEKTLQDLFETFRNTGDALGTGIDPGIMDAIVYLNALGFYTTASCEGHLDHGLPYAWITIEGPRAHQEQKLADEGKSVYWNVYNTARTAATQEVDIRYPGREGRYTEEQYDLWGEVFRARREKHPDYEEYLKIINEMEDDMEILGPEITRLCEEFCKIMEISPEEMCLQLNQDSARIEFAPEKIALDFVREFSQEEALTLKATSDLILGKFAEFLKQKYIKEE